MAPPGYHDVVVKNVNIDVLLTGDYPGDGQPKPVAFPDPAGAAEPDAEGMPVLALPILITLKLASGMTAPQRPQDVADVIALIRRNRLDREWSRCLDACVRERYLELWDAAQIRDEY
jgi:hypothetical protein